MTGDDAKRRKAESIVKGLRKRGDGDGLARDLARCSAGEIYGYLLKRGYIWAKNRNEWMKQLEMPMEAVMDKVQVAQIRIDGGTQSRAGTDMTTVEEYAEAMKLGANFPAVVVYFDGADYWLADGFHRTHAAKKAELVEINAEVRQGTRREAVLHSVSANARHGLKRTNADKRRAIETMLRDDEWRLWADRKIAEMVSVDHKTVGAVRADLVQRGEIPILDNIKVQRGDAEYTVTLNSYPATPAAELDVEAARQIAVQIVVSEKTMIGTGYQSQLSDGTQYFFGAQTVEIDGEKLKVAKTQIAVQLSTVNGTGLYRFNAGQLIEWADERDALVNDREIVRKLHEMTQREYSYFDPKIGKRLVKYGFALERNSTYRITGSGKAYAQWMIENSPVMRVEHEIRIADPKNAQNLRVTEGENALVKLWEAQSQKQAWVRESDFYQSIQVWLPHLAERGYVAGAVRDGVSVWSEKIQKVRFFAITAAGCELIGRDVLVMPEEMPDRKFMVDGNFFIDPNGTFNVQVGDTVQYGNIESQGIVTELKTYPVVVIKSVKHGHEMKALDPNLTVIERAKPAVPEIEPTKPVMPPMTAVDANGNRVGVGSKVMTRTGHEGEIISVVGGQVKVQTAHLISTHKPNTLTEIKAQTPSPSPFPEHMEGEQKDMKRHNDAQFMAAWYAMQSMNNQLEGVTGSDKVFAQHLMSMMAMAREALADRLGIELREAV